MLEAEYDGRPLFPDPEQLKKLGITKRNDAYGWGGSLYFYTRK